MADEAVKKTVRKLPTKLFVFVEYKLEDGKVIISDKLEIVKDVNEVLNKIQDPAFLASHKMFTLGHDDLYI